mmetsp:Transcript_11955/g.21720  ORF Transcript_11955/g.21720 Transcript_11955/m.21720 type:complete len:221 (-) Transcript_11955:192-854(-)
MYTRFSKRRRIAASSSQGTFVAPRTKTFPSFDPIPSICTRNSVFILRDESLSPSVRLPQRESTSSINMIALPPGDSRAISNKFLTKRSLSPCHLLTRSAEETAKKVELASVATAFAKYDLPVPGGPYNRIPLNGRRFPVNNCGNRVGRITVSFSDSFARSRPATSSHFTSGVSVTMAPDNAPRSFVFSASSSSSPSPLFFVPVAPPPFPPLVPSSFCLLI